jgi:uncharacterized protein YjgD (DUF1641 family)
MRQISQEISSIFSNMTLPDMAKGVSLGASGFGIEKIIEAIQNVQNISFNKEKTDEIIGGARSMLMQLSQLVSGDWWSVIGSFSSPTANIAKIFETLKIVQDMNFNKEKTDEVIRGAQTLLSQLSGLVEGSIFKTIANIGTSSIDNLNKIGQTLNLFNNVSLTETKASEISTSARTISSAFNGLTVSPGFFNNDTQIQQVIANIAKFNSLSLNENSTEIASFVRTIVSSFNGATISPGFFNDDREVQQVISNIQKFQNSIVGSNELTTYARTIFSTFNGMMLTPGFFNDTEQVQQVIGNIQKFQNINVGIIDGVVTSMNQLKGLGSNLGSDIQGVSSFTESVSGLRSQLEASASAAERLKEAAGSIPGGVGGLAGANNAGGVTEATLQSTMGQVRDSLGRMESYLSTMAASAQATPAPRVTG